MSREENSFDPQHEPLDENEFSLEDFAMDGGTPEEPLLDDLSTPEPEEDDPFALDGGFGELEAESYGSGNTGSIPLDIARPAGGLEEDPFRALGLGSLSMGGGFDSPLMSEPEDAFSSFSFDSEPSQPVTPMADPFAASSESEFGDSEGLQEFHDHTAQDAESFAFEPADAMNESSFEPEPLGAIPVGRSSATQPVMDEGETVELELSRAPVVRDMFGGDMPADESEAGHAYAPSNRPASGARQARPGEVLSFGFDSSENAGDFLGLDVELTERQAMADPGYGLVAGDMAPGVSYEETPFGGDYEAVDPEYTAEYDSAYDSGDDAEPSDDPYAFDDAAAEEEYAFEEGRSRRPVGVVVALLLIAGLGGTAYQYGPGLLEQYTGQGGDVEVASVDPVPPKPTSRPVPTAQPVPAVTPSNPTASVKDPGSTKLDGSRGAGLTEPAVEAPSDPLASGGTTDPTGSQGTPLPPVDPVASYPSLPGSGGPDSSGLEGLLAGGTPVDLGGETQPPGTGVLNDSFPNLEADTFDWANPGKLDILWRGSDIPMGAIFSPARTIMPQVGDVRVFMTTGEIFEGRLYAVGEGRVWLRTEPGQVGLDGKLVERFQKLAVQADGPSLVASGLAAGKRVRVEVPGGSMYGRVIKAEEGEVVLVTDAGGRVTVASDSVHAIGKGRTYVVHR